MLTAKQVEFLRAELETAKNPLFIHDDDADGLCSFLLLYRMRHEGKGVILKTAPKLDLRLLHIVNELNPDKIFVLDVPIIEQEFIDAVKRPIFWIDHHQPLQRKNVHYFNPRLGDPNLYVPTTMMAYQVSQKQDDLWIAAVGCLADWYPAEFLDEFSQRFPDLLSQKSDLTTMVYKEPIGALIKLFFFLLKGPTSEVRKSVKILTRIASPGEILQQSTPAGKFLYQRFEKINQQYEVLLQQAKKSATRSKVLLFFYSDQHWSFTSNLANELSALYPQKIVIIARKKSGEMKCSLRSQQPILPALEKALVGINGYGGGHANACGAVIKEEDWERFLQRFKEEMKSGA